MSTESQIKPIQENERRSVVVKIESVEAKLISEKGIMRPSVKAIVSGEYEGQVTHLNGGRIEGTAVLPGNLWVTGTTVNLSIIGAKNLGGAVVAVVQLIKEIEEAAKDEAFGAPIVEEEIPSKVLPPVEPEKPAAAVKPVEQPKPAEPVSAPKPAALVAPKPIKSVSSKLKAKAPELVKPGKIKAVLYGISGVGKTTLALSFPAPYYFDVEGGAKGPQYRELLKASGGAYMGPEDGTLSFDTLIDQMQALATEKHPYKTLIVDSLTKLFQTAIAVEQERLGDKEAFGASKKPAVAAMRRMVMWASRLDMNIWFICHEAPEWGMDKNGQRSEIGRIADVWDKLIYELDLAIQATKRGPQRMAIVKKTRLTNFPDGESFPLDYAEFAARHGKEIVEGDAGIITLALPEQVAEIKKLLDIVRIPDADIQKGFEKAGVEKWEEMTTEQATVWQNFLKKRISA